MEYIEIHDFISKFDTCLKMLNYILYQTCPESLDSD